MHVASPSCKPSSPYAPLRGREPQSALRTPCTTLSVTPVGVERRCAVPPPEKRRQRRSHARIGRHARGAPRRDPRGARRPIGSWPRPFLFEIATHVLAALLASTSLRALRTSFSAYLAMPVLLALALYALSSSRVARRAQAGGRARGTVEHEPAPIPVASPEDTQLAPARTHDKAGGAARSLSRCRELQIDVAPRAHRTLSAASRGVSLPAPARRASRPRPLRRGRSLAPCICRIRSARRSRASDPPARCVGPPVVEHDFVCQYSDYSFSTARITAHVRVDTRGAVVRSPEDTLRRAQPT
jgi:hypothetical protein